MTVSKEALNALRAFNEDPYGQDSDLVDELIAASFLRMTSWGDEEYPDELYVTNEGDEALHKN